MTVLFLYNFRRSSNKFPNYVFLTFNFSNFTPQVRIFSVEKRKPKIFGFKSMMGEKLNFHNVKLPLKFSRK